MITSIQNCFRNNSHSLLNFLSFVVTRILALVAYAIAVPIFIGKTSSEEYGVVAIGFSLLGFSTLLEVGIGFVVSQTVGRRIARNGRPHHRLVNQLYSFYLFISFGLSAFGIIITALLPLSVTERYYYCWIALLLPFLVTSATISAIFQAHNKLITLNISRFLFDLGKALTLLVSAVVFRSIFVVGPLLVVFACLRAVFDIMFVRRTLGYRIVPHRENLFRAWRLTRHGLPMVSSVILMLIVNTMDKVLIASWFSKSLVAYYSLAFDLNTKAYFLVWGINSVLYTLFLRSYATRIKSTGLIRISLIGVSICCLVYYLPLAMFPEIIVSKWINPETSFQTAPLVRVMTLAAIAYLFGTVFETALQGWGLGWLIFRAYLIATIVYFCLVFILPRHIGVIGFIWAYFGLTGTLLLIFIREYFLLQGKFNVVNKTKFLESNLRA